MLRISQFPAIMHVSKDPSTSYQPLTSCSTMPNLHKSEYGQLARNPSPPTPPSCPDQICATACHCTVITTLLVNPKPTDPSKPRNSRTHTTHELTTHELVHGMAVDNTNAHNLTPPPLAQFKPPCLQQKTQQLFSCCRESCPTFSDCPITLGGDSPLHLSAPPFKRHISRSPPSSTTYSPNPHLKLPCH